MSDLAKPLSLDSPPHPLKDSFLRWQCRTRQIAMRKNAGRPDDAVMPELTLAGETEPLGQVVTVFSKLPMFSRTAELRFMSKETHDPAQRREKALRLFSETYFQKPGEFSDILTATFPPKSGGAARIVGAGYCALRFVAYNQSYNLDCHATRLDEADDLHAATCWHNFLFNPALPPGTIVLSFTPNWETSSAHPSPI